MPTGTRIAVANLKGGCGKSTLSLNLAAGLSNRGTVCLLDADPQGALRHWSSWAGESSEIHVQVRAADTPEQVITASNYFDYVVIDCPPSLDMAITIPLLRKADHVVMPVLPSPIDLWASNQAVEAINKVRAENPLLKAWVVLNQLEQKSAISRAMKEVLEQLQLPILKTQIQRRAAYRLAMLEGKSVYQLGGNGRQAVEEIESILNEVLQS